MGFFDFFKSHKKRDVLPKEAKLDLAKMEIESIEYDSKYFYLKVKRD